MDRPEAVSPDGAQLRSAIVDKISAMLAYWDADLRCRFANHAYEQWFGVSPEALIGKHISELLGPLYQLNLPYIQGALRGETQEFERVIPSPVGGLPRHSLTNYIPDIAEGVVHGFFVLVTDISEVKRAGLALKESEARFSGIISISADAIISVDEDQRITIFNEGAEKIFGYAKVEVIGRDLGILLPARLHEAHRRHVAAFVAGEATSRPMGAPHMTIVGVRKNRDEFPAEASISKLDTGRKTLLTIALRDITERKRTEMEQQVLAEAGTVLAQSLNYKQTLTTIAELVVRHTGDLCIVDMIEDDARVRRLTVAHADPTKAAACEALAQLSLETGHLVGGAPLETKQALVFDDINPEVLEATGQDEDQLRALREIAPRSAIVVPLLSADRVLGYLVLASSRPRRYGAHDLRLLTELARRASLAIENARLYAAAQRATRARDDMMGIVAHDVRSPLQAIRLAAQVLERKLAKAGVADGGNNLENILLSVGRANRLIEDLLEITRIEAGAMALSCSVLAPLPVVSEGLDFQRLAAAEASLELRLEIAEELPAIWADRHRLLQVLENVIGNAIKFTPEGGRVTIAAAGRPGEIVFSVADTGTGIPPHSLPHVFDRFWQAERAERHGAGLGLPICKGIVEAHGGRIWVESTPDRGSTIFFTIPTATGAAPLPREPGAPFA